MAFDWERQPTESARAYAAFCHYRDLGPGRSLAAAYGAWRRASGATGDPAKAAGFWQDWSSRHNWVERAAAYDAHLDAERRARRELLLLQLEDRRWEFELRNQDRLEDRVAKIEALLDKADKHPLTDVVQEKAGPGEDGKVSSIKTKIKGLGSLSGYARLAKEANDTARQAITGVRPPRPANDAELQPKSGVSGEFVWVPPPDPDGTCDAK